MNSVVTQRFGTARFRLGAALAAILFLGNGILLADYPRPALESVYPAGGQQNSTIDVEFFGSALDECSSVRCLADGITFEHLENTTFRLEISETVPTGLYDVQVVTKHGVSSTRRIYVSGMPQHVEEKRDESSEEATQLSLGTVVSAAIGGPGDIDFYEFEATQGQLLVVEAWAERLDSQLRAVLELYDPAGQRVAVNRGFFGKDPAIAHRVKTAGRFRVRIADLVYAGGASHFYRLDIHAGPRVVYSTPSLLQEGIAVPVTFVGWNLSDQRSDGEYSVLSQDVLPQAPGQASGLPVTSIGIAARQISYQLEGCDSPVPFHLTTEPVSLVPDGNTTSGQAFPLTVPTAAQGQLARPGEVDWYSLELRAGEVITIEAFGSRVGSPVDLQLHIVDNNGKDVLASFKDDRKNVGDLRFPTAHNDPAGRWSAPADGRYLVAVRNVIADTATDLRRQYHLFLRRALPHFEVVAVAHPQSPSGVNVRRGGRALYDLLAIRRAGFDGPLHIRALNLPTGVSCPDVWIGPGVSQSPLVLTAENNTTVGDFSLSLEATVVGAAGSTARSVRGATMVRTGVPTGWGRPTEVIPWSVAGEAPASLNGTALRERVSQGSILDIQVIIDRESGQPTNSVQLTGVGLPAVMLNRLAEIPEGESQAVISFYVPPTMPPGRYTVAVLGTSTMLLDKQVGTKPAGATLVTNSVSFEVYPAPYIVKVDLAAPVKIKRGQIIQLNYTAIRQNGFIGKIHTDLTAPGGVIGLRARGVTFVGQTESGVLQVIANENAPLGRQENLRLEGVGTVEDEPVFLGSCFVWLEIVE